MSAGKEEIFTRSGSIITELAKRVVLEQRGNKLISDTDSVKSHGLVQAGQVVRWGLEYRVHSERRQRQGVRL